MRNKSTRVAAGIGLVAALGLFAVGVDAHAEGPVGSDANQPETWEDYFDVAGIDCYKDELNDPAQYTVPDAEEDRTWYAVVVKAGENEEPRTIYWDVEAGDIVQHDTKGTISHVILCSVPEVTMTPTPSVTPSVTPSESPSVTPSETPSETPSVTPSESPSMTPSESPSMTPSETPSETPSMEPSASEKPKPTVKPTATVKPTVKPTSTVKPTATYRPSTPAGLPKTGN